MKSPTALNPLRRLWLALAVCALLTLGTLGSLPPARAADAPIPAKPEKTDVTIAVGGKNLFYYLPLTIAERLNYFREEGLNVEIVDFAGGSKALQAVVGGSADVVSGAFEHTLLMRAKGQKLQAFVLQGRAPQIVLAVSTKNLPDYASVADLKGRRIGVTAPGSSTQIMLNYVLAKGGLKASDVSVIGVGAGSGAVAAMRSGQLDAIVNLDPVIAQLSRDGGIRIVADTRSVVESKELYGGSMPAGSLYAPTDFIDSNPGTTAALTRAMVRALKWLQKATPETVARTVPEGYLLGDPSLYMAAWSKVKDAISPDGRMPEDGPATALRAMASIDAALPKKVGDPGVVWTSRFVDAAAKAP